MNLTKTTLTLMGILLTYPTAAAQPDLSKHFKGKDGCFVLYDVKAKKVVTRFNEKRCGERFVACSTFKVPLSVMAFDRGILEDENSTLQWDGQDRGMPDWNRDHSAASWMKNSVVWFSQQLTPLIGTEAATGYLKKFDYGNQDLSGGLTTAWLTSTPNPTLKISADEQVHFLERLWTNKLAVSKRAMELTRKLTYLETSPRGAILHGKTGSSTPAKTQLGWFVGHLMFQDREFVFALNFTAPPPKTGPKFAGMIAKGITKEILAEIGVY